MKPMLPSIGIKPAVSRSSNPCIVPILVILISFFSIDALQAQTKNVRFYPSSSGVLTRTVPTGASVQSTAGLFKRSASVISSGYFRTSSSGNTSGSFASNATGSGGASSVNTYAPTGSNRGIIVSIGSTKTATNEVTSVSFGAVAMTKLGQMIDASNRKLEFWYLLNPSTTAAAITVNWPATANLEAMVAVTVLQDMDQTNPLGVVATSSGSTTASSIDVASGSGDIIVDAVAVKDNAITVGAGQTQILQSGTNSIDVSSSYRSAATGGATTTNMSWTAISGSWVAMGVAVKGQSNDASFTQSSTMASGFTIKAGTTITVKAFATVTLNTASGATIPFYADVLSNGTSIFKSGVATNSGLGANGSSGFLQWTGTIASDVTIPAGQSLVLNVYSDYQTADIRVDYDASSKLSYVELPTSTYVNVSSMNLYDAPYPGGNLVAQRNSWQTVYIRPVVTDPLGSGQINSVGLSINSGSTLTPTEVASTTDSKTYEYAWTAPTNGTYSIAVTANSGTEGTVTTTQSMSYVTLPVVGFTFKAALRNGVADLQWSTLQEQNTASFIVERSLQNKAYAAVATIRAAGNSSTPQQYQYNDDLNTIANSGAVLYRIKQVDLDGRSTYSNVIALNNTALNSARISPNPFTNAVNLSINANASGLAQVRVIDEKGVVVHAENITLSQGYHDYALQNLQNLRAGIYHVILQQGMNQQRLRIVKTPL